MAIDPSIALGVQQPNTTQTLSSMLGLKSQIQQQQIQQQQIQSNSMANQQSATDLQETQAFQGVMKNIRNYQDAEGNIDFNRMVPDVMEVAPKNGSAFLGNVMKMQQAHTEAANSINTLDAGSRAQVGDILYSLKGQSPQVVSSTMDQLGKAYPNLAPAVSYFQQQVLPSAGNQDSLDAALDQAGKMTQIPSVQQDMSDPKGVAVNDGQVSAYISTKPGTSVPQGKAIPGTVVQAQLPPNTPTIGPKGQSGYLGAQPSTNSFAYPSTPFDASGVQGPQRQQILQDIAANNPDPGVRAQAQTAIAGRAQVQGQGQGGFVPSALAPGQAQNMSNNVDEMNRHYAGLNDASSGAQLVQGLTSNIKALAPGAITGTESGRKAYVNGLINALHLGNQATGDLQKDTDLLDKNFAQLSLGTPASSDAARSLVNAARPHSGMSAAAIGDAADQVASQVQANMAIRNYLTPYKYANGGAGDPNGYAQARQTIEGIADPRAWQYERLGPGSAAAKQFLQTLTPQDRAQLIQKTQTLDAMGMFK